jgi:hypothetical protein
MELRARFCAVRSVIGAQQFEHCGCGVRGRSLWLLWFLLTCACESTGSESSANLDDLGDASAPEGERHDAGATPSGPDARTSEAGKVDAAPAAADGSTAQVDASGPSAPPDGAPPDGGGAPSTDAAVWTLCGELQKRAGMTGPAKPLGLVSLLCETADLERFTRPPVQGYRAKLASSYDRGATQEGASGWFGNADHSVYIRDEGDEHVMMESQLPGAITRIWTPNPSGNIRIYVDDKTKPIIDMPMVDFLSGKLEGPWGEPLVFNAGQGFSAYFPIPYARYARVSTTTSAPLYYQVNYREYAPDVAVESYSFESIRNVAPLAAEVGALLRDPVAYAPFQRIGSRTLEVSEASPEASLSLGPVVIREFTVRGFDPSEVALRTTRVMVSVDGERTIDAPLGDLFGAGPGLREHASFAATMSKDALTLRWPMPVASKISVRVESNGGKVAPLRFELRYSEGLPPNHRLFHALWTGARSFDTASPLDWTVLHFRGSGWFVGTALNVTNPTAWWWGEGDEKIFIDGESFPSNFGTGTEDYFGFGWCSNELFATPWIGQTRADGPLNQGRSSQYRWHLADAIPFESELRMSMEILHWISGLVSVSLSQDAVAYWYAAPDGVQLAKQLGTADFAVPPYVPLDSWLPPGTYNCRN